MAANETVGDVTSTWPPAVTPAVVDEHCHLVGDEDCGVGVACRTCDLGGQPIAYHPGISENPYPESSICTCWQLSTCVSTTGRRDGRAVPTPGPRAAPAGADPRRHVGAGDVRSAERLRNSHDPITPVEVRKVDGGWLLVEGRHRWLAHWIAGRPLIRCVEVA
jgi:hypothetical protein